MIIPNFYKKNDSKIVIKNIENLESTDTIIIILPNNNNVRIYDFKNGSVYGGKNFFGCTLSEYFVEGKKKSNAMHGILTID